MAIISYEKFLEIFDFIQGEPEFDFYFTNSKSTYYVVKYKNEVHFGRCGYDKETVEKFGLDESALGSEVFVCSCFEELYNAKTVDGICLKDEWENISDIVVNTTICLADPDGIDDVFAVYKELNVKKQKKKP